MSDIILKKYCLLCLHIKLTVILLTKLSLYGVPLLGCRRIPARDRGRSPSILREQFSALQVARIKIRGQIFLRLQWLPLWLTPPSIHKVLCNIWIDKFGEGGRETQRNGEECFVICWSLDGVDSFDVLMKYREWRKNVDDFQELNNLLLIGVIIYIN